MARLYNMRVWVNPRLVYYTSTDEQLTARVVKMANELHLNQKITIQRIEVEEDALVK
jgi:hypothetical protein